MKVDDFLVELFMDEFEMDVEINIAETCVDPFTLEEFLKLMDREDFFEEFKSTKLTYGFINGLTYGFINGSPELRGGIANLYDTMKADNILITGGAIGANFLTFYSFVEPGDTVISIFPAYQQLYSTARSLGADVKLWKMKWEEHNPTGYMFDNDLLKKICEIAEDANAYVLYDEAYKGLYINEEDNVTSIVDTYDKGISTGSFSKSLSLTGLRLGWIAAKKEIILECVKRRQYTQISNGVIDDALAALAMEKVDRIFKRNNNIVRTNFKILSDWITNEPLIDWVPARVGSVGFMKLNLDMPLQKIC